MKRSNKIYVLMALLTGATEVYSGASYVVNAIDVLRQVTLFNLNNQQGSQTKNKKQASNSDTGNSNTLPAGIVPPQAPAQPLQPVAVSQTKGLANFGTDSVILSYQVEQLPVTAQIASISITGVFGSTNSTPFSFDTDVLARLNASLADGHAVIFQLGITDVDDNLIAYVGLLEETDTSKMFGYAVQGAPAGVTASALTGFTVEYQLATATETNTINLSAAQSLCIFNPTVSVVSPLSGVSIQAVFGSPDKPLVSAPIEFDTDTVEKIQAALQAEDTVTFSVVAEYMFGLGEMVVAAYDPTKKVQIGKEASLAITPEQSDAGDFIAYVVNLSMTGEAGQSSYVRGINQDLQLQVPAVASTSMDFYVPADLAVSIPANTTFPNVTLNGIFSDGSSSAGFVFTAQALLQINNAIANGDNISIVMQQTLNGTALIASAYNINDFDMPVIATATNTVTPAQAKQNLTGYSLTYQFSGQAQPTTLQAQVGQVVTFGTSVYFTLPIDPATLTQLNSLDTRGFMMPQNGDFDVTNALRFEPADFAKIQAALTQGHPVIVGTGYSAENQQMVMQAYDNVTKQIIAQKMQASTRASKVPLFGFVVDYQPAPNANGQQITQPARILVPGGNVMTLVPATMTAPKGISESIISCVSRRNGPIRQLQIQANFGSSSSPDVIELTEREVRRVMNTVDNNGAIFSASVANNYCVFSVWDGVNQNQVINAKAIPVSSGTFSGFSVNYQLNNNQGTIADVISALQQAGANISNLGFNIPAGSSFSSINFNLEGSSGYAYGYPFGYANPWNQDSTVGASGLAADISSTLNSISAQQWTSGISFMLLGLDSNNNIIGDITKTLPATFMLYVFDSMGNILSQTPVPLSNVTLLSTESSDITSFASSQVETGVAGGNPVNNAALGQTYPVLVTVNVGNSTAVAPTAATAAAASTSLAQTISVPSGQTMSLLAVDRVELNGPVAAESITLPTVTTPVTQLWFSPVFAQGFAELALENNPGLMAQLNAVLSQGNQVQFVHKIMPSKYSQPGQGVDCIVSAYNMGVAGNQQNPQEMFTYIFPMVVNAQGVAVLPNNQWSYSNITYQLGTAPSVILAGLQPNNPSFSISVS